jgi:hypothetical protein
VSRGSETRLRVMKLEVAEGEALVFAYCPRAHGMCRVRVPESQVEATEAFYRKQGYDVSTLRHGHGKVKASP